MHPFFWYDLMTPDTKAAEAFYGSVVGWTFGPPTMGTEPYTLVSAAGTGVGGLFKMTPENCADMDARPAWLGYIHVDDVDAFAARVKDEGGKIHREPRDIPEVGRFAVAADPHGAAFFLFKPSSTESRATSLANMPGRIGWHELYAGDLTVDLSFYERLFGWKQTDHVEMDAYGIYQMFAMSDETDGGAMKKAPEDPGPPRWTFYFNVEAIDAASERVRSAGGSVTMGPQQVPGGSWILQGLDPQGAAFALVSAQR